MANKRWVTAALLVVATGACSADAGGGRRVDVAASLYPLEFVAKAVGATRVEVANLTPPGVEPHDVELTSGQVRAIAEADLILYVGSGFQPAVEAALQDATADAVDVLAATGDLIGGDGGTDPHVWLDPRRMAAIARIVGDRLAALDPANARAYRSGARRLADALAALDANFRRGLADCARTDLVTSHEAFGYLAQAYGLEQTAIAGIDPEAEPSPQRLADVARFVRATGVTTIFFEVLVPADVAETLAAEVGIATARLDPIEGAPENGDYFTAMRANLEALRTGLGCR